MQGRVKCQYGWSSNDHGGNGTKSGEIRTNFEAKKAKER